MTKVISICKTCYEEHKISKRERKWLEGQVVREGLSEMTLSQEWNDEKSWPGEDPREQQIQRPEKWA